jgi:hypothetical protein
MKTFNEVTKMLEKSIEEHNLIEMLDAINHYEESVYLRVGYAGPLFYAAECDFTEGVEYLLTHYYHDIVLRPEERDRLWKTALFGYPKQAKSIVILLLEHKLLPSESFLASLGIEISLQKEEARKKIIADLEKQMPDIRIIRYYNDPDKVCIEKRNENV